MKRPVAVIVLGAMVSTINQVILRKSGSLRGIGLLLASSMNFQELYKEFQPRIRRYLSHLVGPDEAEDVAQDVFAKVSQALPEFRGDSTVSTWIYRRDE